jgi:hypothetical protein
MKKIIFTLLILIVFVNTGVCAENFTTNIITEISPNIVGGDNLVMPHFHYYDSWFSVENVGYISYYIYQYNYTGSHKNYTDSFIAVLNPVKDKFNTWWIYIFIGVILFSVIILGIKKVLRI